MTDASTIRFAIAAALVTITGGVCLGTGLSGLQPRTRRRRHERAAAPLPAHGVPTGSSTLVSATPAVSGAQTAVIRSRTRLRILTGEPAPPERRSSASIRAARLLGGMTALGAASAV